MIIIPRRTGIFPLRPEAVQLAKQDPNCGIRLQFAKLGQITHIDPARLRGNIP